MSLTGMQIFKRLPKTNCKECGKLTCLAFAMDLTAGEVDLSECPHLTNENMLDIKKEGFIIKKKLKLSDFIGQSIDFEKLKDDPCWTESKKDHNNCYETAFKTKVDSNNFPCNLNDINIELTIKVAGSTIDAISHTIYTIDNMGAGKVWDGAMAQEDIDHAYSLIKGLVTK